MATQGCNSRDSRSNELDRSALPAMLRRIANQLPLLAAKRAGSELYGSPRLNAFLLFQPNENTLSRIIEDLFDPNGTHGQGTTFLNALFDAIGLPKVSAIDPVRTRREASTAEGRRIDLVIETPSVLLGLENKPWAKQQSRQLQDYLDALRIWSRGRQVALVFLSDQEPQTAKDDVIALPFVSIDEEPSLLSILEAAVGNIKASRARIHVQEFITYIGSQFGNNGMIDESDSPYVEAVEAEFMGEVNRKAIASVLLSSRALHAQVLDEIGADLLNSLREVADDFQVVNGAKLSETLSKKDVSWQLRRASWPVNLSISLEAAKPGFGDIYFGVLAPDPEESDFKADGSACPSRPLIEPALKSFNGGGKTIWYPWWKFAATRHWTLEFAAHIVLHSPTGHVQDHPEIEELRRVVLELASAIDEAIAIR